MRKSGEVLLNYMSGFIDRFARWEHPRNEKSFEGILGVGWKSRLDRTIPLARAVRRLFAEEFRRAGDFRHVVSTPIERLADRTIFSIVFGTRHPKGLSTYRNIEYHVMKAHTLRRAEAREAISEEKTGHRDLFPVTAVEAVLPIDKQLSEEFDEPLAHGYWRGCVPKVRGFGSTWFGGR